MSVVDGQCRDCGGYHPTGGSGIVCDWLHGKPTPGLSPERQEAIARDVLAYIAACEASYLTDWNPTKESR